MQIFSAYIIYFISSQHVSSILKIHSFLLFLVVLFSSYMKLFCIVSPSHLISFHSARVNLKLIKKNWKKNFQQPDQERPLHFYEKYFFIYRRNSLLCFYFSIHFSVVVLKKDTRRRRKIVIKTFSYSLFSFILMVFRMKMLKYTLLLSAACTYI